MVIGSNIWLRTTRRMTQENHYSHFVGYSMICSNGSYILITGMMENTMTFVTPVEEHWLKLEIAQWVLQQGLIQ